MTCGSLYDVLQVPQHATLSEIKLAFRRRALQVHPDKGGSKDAFHQVYDALETLSDPEGRRKYDQQLGAKGAQTQCREPSFSGGERKKPSEQPKARAADGAAKSEKSKSEPGAEASKMFADVKVKLMMRIQCLLKQLPRELRFQVISKDFSQAQRVLLQKWMVDTGATPQRDSSVASSAVVLQIPSPERVQAAPLWKKSKPRRSQSDSGIRGVQRRGRARYQANVEIDRVKIFSRSCELPTALEYLVILTSARQKATDSSCEGAWEDCFQETLVSCALEQGKAFEELELRFIVTQNMGIFIGTRRVKAPVVYCLEDVKKLRYCMKAFRQRVKHCRGNYDVFDFFSPYELEELWQQFVGTVADMFHAIGASATSYLTRIHAWHAEADHVRVRHLQLWERRRMAAHDKEQQRKKHVGKKHVRMAVHEARQLNTLRKLLGRWQSLLMREAQRRENRRRKIFHKHEQGAKRKTSMKRRRKKGNRT